MTKRPPSTSNEAPVTYLAKSLARKTTGPEISSGAMIHYGSEVNHPYWINQKLTSQPAKDRAVDRVFALLLICKVFLVYIRGDSSRQNGIGAYVVLS